MICLGSRPAVGSTRNPRILTEHLLTRSMLIEMYVNAIYNCFA